MTLPPRLLSLALRHDGVLTAADFRAFGLNRAAVHRLVSAGDLIGVARGAHRLAAHPLTDRTRMRIAALRAHERAVLSGAAAAWWWGLVDRHPPIITVTVPTGGHRKKLSATRLRFRDLEPADLTVHSGLSITALPLTVLEAGVEQGIDVVDRALLRRRVTEQQLIDAYTRRRGCKDSATMGTLLALISHGGRSYAERMAIDIFTAHGITGWVAGHPAPPYEIDFAFPAQRVAVEIDGMAYHSDAEAFQRDRRRGNDLSDAGWNVLHFTYSDLLLRPDYVAERIQRALAAAGVAAGTGAAEVVGAPDSAEGAV
ncbi:DUF559 domain-containing protein [Gordonia polyisoprenivorans]|uniref:type IV toxin-antitoxin system AbiEi family antitoxin domain-containing protein n=1 Tax=Gordonia polyisoprenivorans TaxID=84595 RepID=UPI00036E1493|nr:type IV toxin-antitoxin system AbiEi family antitoxin domain-containing protein [Gordonia polyisoprenivorans]UZF57542.1 DUF559 domain-containing protein [Gordonia polyisoprenivorans]